MIGNIIAYCDLDSEDKKFYTIGVLIGGVNKKQYLMSIDENRTSEELARDLRLFADTIEYDIEGFWH